MVAVITAVLVGSEIGVAVVAAFDAPVVGLAVGGVGALASLIILMRYQRNVWARAAAIPITDDATSV
jgi:hypothetical protein